MEKIKVPIREKILIDVDEFKILTGIGDDKARELVGRKDFPKVRVGNRNKIILSEVDKYFIERKGEFL